MQWWCIILTQKQTSAEKTLIHTNVPWGRYNRWARFRAKWPQVDVQMYSTDVMQEAGLCELSIWSRHFVNLCSTSLTFDTTLRHTTIHTVMPIAPVARHTLSLSHYRKNHSKLCNIAYKEALCNKSMHHSAKC